MTEVKNDVSETAAAETEAVEKELAENTEEILDETEDEEIELSDNKISRMLHYIKNHGILVAVICCFVTISLLFLLVLFNPFHMNSVEKLQKTLNIGNPHSYSDAYIDTTGRTVGDVAEEMEMDLREFLVYYNLPEDMEASVNEHAALSYIPVKTYAEKQLGITFEEAKLIYGWGDDVTEAMTIGEAIDKTTLAMLYGESLENMKVQYGLDETVTGETLYGEVREKIESQVKAAREAEEATVMPVEEITAEPTENVE